MAAFKRELEDGIYITDEINPHDIETFYDQLREKDLMEVGNNRIFSREGSRKLGVYTREHVLLGIWSSAPRADLGAAAWGWLTTREVVRHRLAFCKGVRKCIMAWWDYEDPNVIEGIICEDAEYREATKYVKRFVIPQGLAEFVKTGDFCGRKYNVYRYTRPGYSGAKIVEV